MSMMCSEISDYLLHFHVCNTSGSVMERLAAAVSRKSNRYLTIIGGSVETCSMALKKLSMYAWRVPCK
ncbi:hypothetical protein DPMN_017307 [Dreissena polymorpha]|uniref:Uncharacterized protein n=1 Tax=Dreissena polymorpha TaxID=45954 RepID=A0A9D4NGE9_DREPO|nr:hypothetical protein DPMN_017307 [Dreissena polymorpha]